jgi:hypothetical protein
MNVSSVGNQQSNVYKTQKIKDMTGYRKANHQDRGIAPQRNFDSFERLEFAGLSRIGADGNKFGTYIVCQKTGEATFEWTDWGIAETRRQELLNELWHKQIEIQRRITGTRSINGGFSTANHIWVAFYADLKANRPDLFMAHLSDPRIVEVILNGSRHMWELQGFSMNDWFSHMGEDWEQWVSDRILRERLTPLANAFFSQQRQ